MGQRTRAGSGEGGSERQRRRNVPGGKRQPGAPTGTLAPPIFPRRRRKRSRRHALPSVHLPLPWLQLSKIGKNWDEAIGCVEVRWQRAMSYAFSHEKNIRYDCRIGGYGFLNIISQLEKHKAAIACASSHGCSRG